MVTPLGDGGSAADGAQTAVEAFVRQVPKAELHVHLEGTLEPELLFDIGRRNGVPLRFRSVEEVRRAYEFDDLQSFLDLYYEGAAVLRTPRDFYDLAWAYCARAAAQNVRHAELFFDPQAHTTRGVPLGDVLEGLQAALRDARARFGLSAALILCFLRHLPAEDAMRTLEEALAFRDGFIGVGLDSSEAGHPPAEFKAVFERARANGLRAVAHAGEEGPPAYVWQALDLLGAARIDHGVRSAEDPRLLERLARERVPLTVCPISNVKLRVFPSLEAHNVKLLMDRGLCVTVNSDDPAYFGGYVNDNLLAVARAFRLSLGDVAQLAASSFEASFLDAASRRRHVAAVEAAARAAEGTAASAAAGARLVS